MLKITDLIFLYAVIIDTVLQARLKLFRANYSVLDFGNHTYIFIKTAKALFTEFGIFVITHV